MDIAKIARNIIKKFKTNNPFELADYLDIEVYYRYLEGIRAFYTVVEDVPLICIDKGLNDVESKISMAHEIAHFLLHKDMNRIFMDTTTLFCSSKYENEANLLAAYIIIPDDDVEEYILNEYTYSQISDITGIDAEIVEKRCCNM